MPPKSSLRSLPQSSLRSELKPAESGAQLLRSQLLGVLKLGVLLLILPSMAAAQSPPQPLEIGQPLPADALGLERLDVGAATTTLEALRGEQGLLVIFAANTCAYVTDWLDRFPRIAKRTAELGVGFAVVNSNARKRRNDDSQEAMAALQAEHFPSVPYLLDADSALADLFGATRTPEIFLFGPELGLLYRGLIDDHSGPLANVTQPYLNEALDGFESGTFPEATAPIGCSVLRPRRRKPAGS